MVRRGLMVALASMLATATAQAQTVSSAFTGFATVYIGAAHAGDVRDVGWAPGVSVAVTDPNGIGAEVDLSHVTEFDAERFVESSVTSFTVNATWVWPEADARVRPYVLGGVGLLRVRACGAECQPEVNRTDWAMDAGGGVFVLFNETVGLRGDVRYFRYFQRYDDLPLNDNGYFDFWRTTVGVVVSWPVR